jgi:3-dehydroquinate synthase
MKEIFSKGFNVFMGDDVFENMAQNLIEREYSKVFLLMDENTERDCYPILKNFLVNVITIKIKSGEQHKTIKTAEYIWHQLHDNFADRRAVMINLGGGVVSDIGGFCAATYKRGIDFINVPTSLLGMVDASIGGKLACDIDSHKNMVGVFAHPKDIYIYSKFLNTLPIAEKRCGLAELSKHALIDSKPLWNDILENSVFEFPIINNLIQQSAKIKINIVKNDPYEKGLRKVLNFGHTIGHAIETWSLKNDKNPLKHGEAVAIGMLCEAFISNKLLGLSNKELNQIVQFVGQNFSHYKSQWDVHELISYMKNDKKNYKGNYNFSLLKKVGKAKIDVDCSTDLILESLSYYQGLGQQFPSQHSA